jgi:uncharacterized protein (DUF1501 family)
MRRRNFISKLGFAAGAPIAFQGVPLKLFSQENQLQRLASQSTNDRVLVILQMHGGNDGLNTFVPLSNYNEYYFRRSNIALPYQSGNRTLIPLDSTVQDSDRIGLHPDMQGFKDLYDRGRAAVIQGVSYENNNGSHFRGRDIWFMGGDADDYFSSGWVGRFLNQEYAPLTYPADFPTSEMPDPLALEMGNDVSLLFHQTGNIPTSLSLNTSPGNLSNLIESLDGFSDEGVDPRGLPPDFLTGSPYAKEMDWILGLEDKSEVYMKRLAEIYDASSDSPVDYPERYPFASGRSRNPLSGQLQLVARLLGGGLKTKVFLLKIGGFDTHANQVENSDPTLGGHAALLYHINAAMKAFDEDLSRRGLADKVLTVTMSEFGRRVASNGSYGTDHGTGAPVMIFGSEVNAGIYGTNPDMSQNNVGMQFDYRQIYANLLKDWLGVDQNIIANDIFYRDFIAGSDGNGGSYDPMNLIQETILGEKQQLLKGYHISSIYPNPATNYVQAELFVNDFQNVSLELIHLDGKVLLRQQRRLTPGQHLLSFQLDQIPGGIYFLKAKSDKLNDTKRIIIRK